MAGDESKPQALATAWSTSCGSTVLTLLVSCKGLIAVVTKSKILVLEASEPLKVRSELQGNASGITYAAFSTDGANLIAGHTDGFLMWWEVDTGEVLCTMQFPFLEADDAQGPESTTTGPPPIASIACSLPPSNKEGIKELGGKPTESLVAVAGGRSICVFRQGGELCVFRQGREHVQTIGNQKPGVSSVLLLNGNVLVAAVGNQINSWVLSGEGYKVLQEGPAYMTEPAATIVALTASPNGNHIAASCVTGAVHVWSVVRDGSTEKVKPLHKFPQAVDCLKPQANPSQQLGCMVWESSSQFLATAKENDALIWEVSGANSRNKDNTVCMTPDQSTVTCLAFQPEGRLLGAATEQGQVYMFDCSNLGAKGSTFGSSQLTYHVAAARVGAAASPNAVTALCWHTSKEGASNPGLLVVANDAGDVVALKPAMPPAAEPKSETHTSLKDILSVNPKLLDVNTSRSRSAMQPAGWGGQPLLTNGLEPAAQQQQMGYMRPQSGPKRQHQGGIPSSNGLHPNSPQAQATTPPTPTPQQGAQPPAASQSSNQQRLKANLSSGSSQRSSQRPQQATPPMPAGPQGVPPFRPDIAAAGVMPHAEAQQLIPGWGMMPLQGYRWSMQHMGAAMPYTQIMPAHMAHMAGGMVPFMTPTPMQHPYGAVPPSPGGPAGHGMAPVHGMPPPGAPPVPAPVHDHEPEPREIGESREHREPRKLGSGSAGNGGAASHPEGPLPKPSMPHHPMHPPKAPPRPAMPGMPMGHTPMYMYAQPHPHWGMGSMAYPQQWPSYGYYYHPYQQMSPISMVPQGPPSRSGATTPFSQGSDEGPPAQPRPSHPRGPPDDRASSYSKAGSMSEAGSVVDSEDKVVLTLYVGNLAPGVDEQALHSWFIQYGTVVHAQVIRDKASGQSRGFGFVTYQHPSSAQNAMQNVNNQVVAGPFDNRPLRVKPSNKR